MNTIAIVGANLAGGRAAETLRNEGFDGRVILVGAEPFPPYERPPLSKGLLLGETTPEKTYLRSLDAWSDLGVELHLGRRVTTIDGVERAIELDDGTRHGADEVLLCTGGRSRQLNVPGVDFGGVTYLRHLDESLWLAGEMKHGVSVVVIGAGFIGAEVAAAAVARGCRVTMVEVANVPLLRVLGPDLGRHYAEAHRSRGVDLRLGVDVARIDGDQRVRRVVLSDGTSIDADVVVIGVGLDPATELARGLHLEVSNGIVVDEQCQTSTPGIFAAGDVTNHPNPIFDENFRLESWQNAQDQGVAAARSMLGKKGGYATVPWFWSDQYDLNLQIAGRPQPDDEIVRRGEPESMEFCEFHLRQNRLVGVIAVNRRREVRASMKLIEQRTEIGREVLSDESIDLRSLLAPVR